MISLRSLPLRNTRYHWRSNVPVVLGVAIGTAVLTGALIVGDSLRGSLREQAERQLNGVDSAYVGNRLVREELADGLPGQVLPAMILQGSVRNVPGSGPARHLGRVTVVGLTRAGQEKFGLPTDGGGAVLSARVAERLGITAGDRVELGVQKFSTVPRSSLLGRRDVESVSADVRTEVAAVLPRDHPAAEFSLTPNPSAPLLVYVPLVLLQTHLEQAGRVNALLAFSGSTEKLNESLSTHLTLDDWGLRAAPGPHRNAYVSVEAEALILDPPTVAAVEAAARELSVRSERTITYLANAIAIGPEPVWNNEVGDPKRVLAYSVVASLDPSAAPPLGPFLPEGTTGLAEDEIALTSWAASQLSPLRRGDPVTLTYFKPEMEAGLEEASATFRFAGFVPLEEAARDRDLTPPYPGVTDKLTIRDWNAPFDLNNRRIRPRDEEYWKDHRATPKAYITRAAGERLFGSRFGSVTSVRVAPIEGKNLDQTTEALKARVLGKLNPGTAGLSFDATRSRLLDASRGGTDFGVLFLMFSGLLILSALLLVGLLFRLAMERRGREVGLLLASGYSTRQVRRVLLDEGALVAVAGAALGLALALVYARGMLFVLTVLWPDVEIGRFLRLHVTPFSLVIGFVGSILVATGSIWFSLRTLVRVSPPALLRGESQVSDPSGRRPVHRVRSLAGAVILGAIGVALLLAGTTRSNPDERSMAFFGGGSLLLTAGLVLARAFLRSPPAGTLAGHGTEGLVRLGVRNARRNPTRSLLTAVLISFAMFLVISVESFRRKPDEDFLKPGGGSGGFRIIAETDVPIFQPFDRGAGRDDLLDRLQKVYQQEESRDPTGPSRRERLEKATAALDSTTVFSFRLQSGDDASCLNLFQAGRPRVMGVPDELIARGGFRFAQTEAVTDEDRSNPWLLLTRQLPEGVVPVFAEQNTALFMLEAPVGGELTIPDENGLAVRVRIVGTLQDSPFQSELLMSDANFRKLYPRQEGFRVFLVDAPVDRQDEVAGLLEVGLRANGMTATPTTERVAVYQAVVGAYLTTFQLLGGFALLLAVLGLGVVILRSVWERVGELALLRAVGYRTRALQSLVVSETIFVLMVGLAVGGLAAVASVLPNLTLGGEIPVARIAVLLLAVLAVGFVVAGLATAGVARAPLIAALRKD